MQKNTYGKFASAEELLRGYNALQQAFTQKCQQLAELNKQVAVLSGQNEETNQNDLQSNLSEINKDITSDNESPSFVGINTLSENDGTNNSSPAEVAEVQDVKRQTFCTDNNDNFVKHCAQSMTSKGTNGTSPSTYHAENNCQNLSKNVTDLDEPSQTAGRKTSGGTAVPTTDCNDTDDTAVQNDCNRDNVSEQNVARNDTAKTQLSDGNTATKFDKNSHTYEEICDTSVTKSNVDDSAESTQSGVSTDRQKASDDLARAQKILAENKQLVRQILDGTLSEIPPAVMSGGGNLSLALPSRPKTLREASELAKKIFD